MKLWQKIYMITMLLFVVLLNSGMFLVFDMTYQKNLSAEKASAESEYHLMSSGILRNMQSLERQSRNGRRTVQVQSKLYESDGKYYL